MPALGPATAALSDAELRETIDLHSGVLARMSDKIDEQGILQLKLIDTVIGGMDAILDAARAAKHQTDPARYARHIEQELDKTIGRILDRLDILHSSFEADRCNAAYRLEDLVEQEETTLQRLRADQERAGRWKKRIPFIALFGLVLALGLAIALPRFMAVNGTSCAVLGGEWLRGPESGKQACVFYAE
jgi:hypothetical protein